MHACWLNPFPKRTNPWQSTSGWLQQLVSCRVSHSSNAVLISALASGLINVPGQSAWSFEAWPSVQFSRRRGTATFRQMRFMTSQPATDENSHTRVAAAKTAHDG